MTLILNNDDVGKVLTMEITMKALEKAYQELFRGEAVCRPRIDIQVPTQDASKIYQWGTMEGGSMSGYFAIRMKSDVIYEQEYGGARTQEKYCVQPGKFCGLILLVNIHNGEPVALLNDGYLQHMRVGADSGIGVKYMAREDAQVVGMLGSGGMARSHMDAFTLVRKIKRLQVYSPTKEHREQYAKEMAQKFGIEAVALDRPEDVYKGADIVAGCTDSAVPVVIGKWLEEGTHVTCIGGKPDEDTLKRIDVSLRLGNAPAPWGLPQLSLADEHVTYGAIGTAGDTHQMKRAGKRAHGVIAEDRAVLLADLLSEKRKGGLRPSRSRIRSEVIFRACSFFPLPAGSMSWPRRKALGTRSPPTGCCRTFGIDVCVASKSGKKREVVMETRLISPHDLRGIVSMEEAVAAVRRGFSDWGTNPEINAPRRRIHIPSGVRVSVHQGGVPSAGATGLMTHCEWVKPLTDHQEYPRLNHPVIVLYDSAEGELKGIIVGEITCSELPDNVAVTGLRTAATSAVGTDALAREDAAKIGILGSGGQARNHLLALAKVRNVQEVRVYSRTGANREKFAAEMSGALKAER